MPILFYGDPHKNFGPLFEAIAADKPEHVVIVGDLELDRPFRETLAPVLAEGMGCWWIMGNHDTDSIERHDFLFENFPEGNLDGRAVDLACSDGTVRVAGLGGVYKGKVWYPKDGGQPRYETRAEWMASMGKGGRWRGGLPLHQRDTIFPEDHRRLERLRCDVLVTHEAPTSMPFGFDAIDELAAAMRASLVVHGHHHDPYEGKTATGIPVRGLDLAEPFILAAGSLRRDR